MRKVHKFISMTKTDSNILLTHFFHPFLAHFHSFFSLIVFLPLIYFPHNSHNMFHTIYTHFCNDLFYLKHNFVLIHGIYLSISVRVASLAVEKLNECPNASGVNLVDTGKIIWYQNPRKHLGQISLYLPSGCWDNKEFEFQLNFNWIWTMHNKMQTVCVIPGMFCITQSQ